MTTQDTQITVERIDALLSYLPALEAPGRQYVLAWRGGATSDGVTSWPHPEYAPDVVAFFLAAGQPWWSDASYAPGPAQRMLEDDAAVARADMEDIKTLLTVCVRGERFCDGWWANVLKRGRVQAILRRLRALREALLPDLSPSTLDL